MASPLNSSWQAAANSSAARYVVLSGISLCVNVGLTTLLHEIAHVREELAFLAALVAAFLCNFVGMRYFVYRAASADVMPQLARFLASSLGFRGAEYAAFLLLHTVFGVYYLLACAAILVTSFVSKYFFYRVAVFGNGL